MSDGVVEEGKGGREGGTQEEKGRRKEQGGSGRRTKNKIPHIDAGNGQQKMCWVSVCAIGQWFQVELRVDNAILV